MNRLLVLALPLLVTLAGCADSVPVKETKPPAPARAFGAKSEPVPNPVAKMSLVANAGGVAPGKRTWLGARFVIADGWHVYGKDPGDAGMPTKVTFETPPGVTIGEAVYAPTKRFVDEGDIVTHGYERETVLLFPVDAPEGLVPGTELTFKASGSWLACKHQCIRESGEAVLTLTAGDATAPSPESAAIFARYTPPPTETIPSP